MSPNRFLILFLLPLLAACPAKSKSPLLFLGEMSASASLPTDWVQDAYLKASNAGAGDHFGFSVAVAGDIAVIGGGQFAYIFQKDSAGIWTEVTYLQPFNSPPTTNFVCSIDMEDSTIVIGACTDDNASTSTINDDNASITYTGTASHSGAVYVFKKDPSGNWIQDAYLKASNAGADDAFGASVAISDNTIVVGAYREDNSSTTINNTDSAAIIDAGTGNDSGAVYVFKQDGSGNWVQDAYLKASNAGAGDLFGQAIAISESTIVVGAPIEGNGSTAINNTDNAPIVDTGTVNMAGAAYIFKKNPIGDWIQDAYLKPSLLSAFDLFGVSVGISADLIAIGANGVGDEGSVYIFRSTNEGSWYQSGQLKASNASVSDAFGTNVAVSDSMIVVSAISESNAFSGINNNNNAVINDTGTITDSGAVYIFRLGAEGIWYQDAYVKASNPDESDFFGWHGIAISGSTLVVGARWEDNASTAINNTDNATIIDEGTASNSGAAYIFMLK
jgi:hypothetical protein